MPVFRVFFACPGFALLEAILSRGLILVKLKSMPKDKVPNMSSSQNWKSFFTHWPGAIAQRGLIITSLNDSVPFKNFWLKDELLLLERTNPDALGGRFILLSFDVINSVKFTDPLRESTIKTAGFITLASKPAPQLV